MRTTHQLRDLSFQTGFQVHAAGSCLIKLGDTHVLCTASVEEEIPRWLKGQGRGWVTAEYGLLPGSTHTRTGREAAKGKQQGRTIEIQRLIGRSLRQAVDLTLLGERQITVDCDVLNADGGTRCAAITGGWVALALALRKVGCESALVRQVAAVSVGVLETGERTGIVLDLAYVEDSAAAVDCNLVAARPSAGGSLDIVEFQATGEGRPFTRAESDGLMDLGLSGCDALMAAQLRAL